MINSHAPRTAQVPAGLAEAARAGPPPGLLAGSQDFIACLPPGLENCVRIKNGARNGFRRFPQPGPWLRPDDRAHSVSASRSSLAAAILRLAELRSLSRISRTAPLSGFLAGEAGGAAAFGASGALQADQAGRTQADRRGIPAALGGQFNPIFWRLEIDTWFI